MYVVSVFREVGELGWGIWLEVGMLVVLLSLVLIVYCFSHDLFREKFSSSFERVLLFIGF